MDSRLFAKILPTKKDGDRTIGTGYPIGKDLVLTARHVVIFPERDSSKPIEIKWPDLGNEPIEGKVIFDGGSQCDIAVIQCNVPVQAQTSSSLLSQRFPIEHERWAGFGYPEIGKDKETDTCKKVSALGVFHPPDAASHKISLTSKSDALEKEGWCGISGAPVFQDSILYAVITSTPKNRSECFTAVSIPWLLANDTKFREAVGLGGEAVACDKFIVEQRQQIKALLAEMGHSKLFLELVVKLELPAPVTPTSVSEKLLAAFEQDRLALLDTLLQASADALKLDASDHARVYVRSLFFLFASLMLPSSLAARQALIRLSVYTKMATELHLAPLYDTNPDFTVDEEGEVKGKYAVDASAFVREKGWVSEGFKEEAFNVMFTEVHKGRVSVPKVINTFEYKRLNTKFKQRQNRSRNQLHRVELHCGAEGVANNPFHNLEYCQALNASDCLPDLPIVHYGEMDMDMDMEAELSAKMDDLFEILLQYGQTL